MERIDLKILSALATAAPHGMPGAEISKLTGIGAGSLYPALVRMEGALIVTSEWEKPEPAAEPRRRLYWRGPRAPQEQP